MNRNLTPFLSYIIPLNFGVILRSNPTPFDKNCTFFAKHGTRVFVVLM